MKFEPKALNKTQDISRSKSTPKEIIKNILSVITGFGLLYLLLGALGSWWATSLSDEDEMKYFSSLGKSRFILAKDQKGLQRTQQIFDQLLQHHSGRKLDYKLSIIEMDSPNAFAMPGGSIGVSRALLKEVHSDIGLAMVLAHELGHHEFRHTLKQLGRNIIIGVAFGLISADNGLVNASISSLSNSHSREQERQADAFGIELVYKTYGSTQGALEFFEVISTEHNHEESQFKEFFSTHPLTKNRIDDMKQLAEDLETKVSPLQNP